MRKSKKKGRENRMRKERKGTKYTVGESRIGKGGEVRKIVERIEE